MTNWLPRGERNIINLNSQYVKYLFQLVRVCFTLRIRDLCVSQSLYYTNKWGAKQKTKLLHTDKV